MVGKAPPQMIGTVGSFSRIAFDTAIAESNCGPPMTLTPTAATEPSPTARTAVETKSRSTLPSMIVDAYLPSSDADKLMIARGKRAWRCRCHPRVDEQNTSRSHDFLCGFGGTSLKTVNLSLTNRRSASTEISK